MDKKDIFMDYLKETNIKVYEDKMIINLDICGKIY